MRACSDTIRTLSAVAAGDHVAVHLAVDAQAAGKYQVAFDARGNADQAVDFAFCITTEHGNPLA
jgi:3-deoxy-D-arabino-heptulosonate 7-phosphate (DAHP) synthase class II